MIMFITRKNEDETLHWVEVPALHTSYVESKEWEEETETIKGKDVVRKVEVNNGLGAFVVHLPPIGEENKAKKTWDFEQIRHWRRMFRAGVDNFSVEWKSEMVVRLTNSIGGVEFTAQSMAETIPLRKAFGRHIAKGPDGKEPPFQIRVSVEALVRIQFICEHRPADDAEKKLQDVLHPHCDACGVDLVRAAFPAGFVKVENQQYWKCPTDGCTTEIAEPPLAPLPPPTFKDDYETLSNAKLQEKCIELSIQVEKKGVKLDRADMISALRKMTSARMLLEGANA